MACARKPTPLRPSFLSAGAAATTAGDLAPALLLQHAGVGCTTGHTTVPQGKSGRETHELFPLDLLVRHLHSIQVFKMQLHQPVDLRGRERDPTGMSEKEGERQGRREAASCLLLMSLSLGRARPMRAPLAPGRALLRTASQQTPPGGIRAPVQAQA